MPTSTAKGELVDPSTYKAVLSAQKHYAEQEMQMQMRGEDMAQPFDENIPEQDMCEIPCGVESAGDVVPEFEEVGEADQSDGGDCLDM